MFTDDRSDPDREAMTAETVHRETVRALPAAIGCLALPLGLGLGVLVANTPWAWVFVAACGVVAWVLVGLRRWLRGRAAQGTEVL